MIILDGCDITPTIELLRKLADEIEAGKLRPRSITRNTGFEARTCRDEDGMLFTAEIRLSAIMEEGTTFHPGETEQE